ncbi:MAG: prolyl oligopeptidase family serine peptidase [Gemmataceae bacterium]|nr:prolyl oligopeptidase family serine peptidase [Gemmataceae bacterium]
MSRQRRWFAVLLLMLAPPVIAADRNDVFDPLAWLRARKLGKLTTVTPQSGKPLRGLAAATRAEWEKERALYLQAFRELIGPWPRERPPLQARVIERKEFAQFIRYKVGFRSLPSEAEYASEIRAWLFVPTVPKPPRPAIVVLHQTVPQGKDEPAGVRATLPWLAHALYYAQRGYVTLAPDAIGYGERTAGGTARTGFELADAAPILDRHPPMTLLGLMLYDVTRCVDYLETRPEVDRDRIGVLGHSQGGLLVNCVLGLEPRFRVGIASCGYGLFRTDQLFPQRWAGKNSAYLPRLALYAGQADELPLDFLHILALAAPRPHLIQTCLGDTIWTPPAVAENAFVMKELKRVRSFYGQEAEAHLVSIEPGGGDRHKNHGWYPETQKAADALLDKVLQP